MIFKKKTWIDASWLELDEPVPKRNSNLGSRIILCLAMATLAVWSWPWLSHRYLTSQLRSQFQNAQSSDDAIPALVGLGQWMPSTTDSVVEGLCREDEEIPRVAHRILSQYLEESATSPVAQQRLGRKRIAQALADRSGQFSPDGHMLAASIASRVFALNLHDTHPLATDIASLAEKVIAAVPSAQATSNPEKPTDSELPRVASRSIGDGRLRISDQPVSSEPSMVEPVGIAGQVAGPPLPPLPPPDVQAPSMRSNIRSLSDSSDEESGGLRGGPSPMDNGSSLPALPSARARLADVSATPSAGLRETSFQSTSSSSHALEAPARSMGVVQAISEQRDLANPITQGDARFEGMEKIADIGEVVRILGSKHSRRAQAALQELQRRGFSNDQLQMAVDLTRGSTQERLSALDSLGSETRWPTIAWLHWMGEDSQREIRLRAVTLLGRMQDPESRRVLRMLAQRERDAEVVQQIERSLALVASPNAAAGRSTAPAVMRSGGARQVTRFEIQSR